MRCLLSLSTNKDKNGNTLINHIFSEGYVDKNENDVIFIFFSAATPLQKIPY